MICNTSNIEDNEKADNCIGCEGNYSDLSYQNL